MSGRKSCVARIPATIAPGYYIGELTQRLSYGVTKTARTRGAVATNASFFGFNVSPYTLGLAYGASINNPLITQQRVDRFYVSTQPSWYSGWCSRTRAPRGLYQANIAVSGQKD
ncbi:MAG: hypothetical protein NTV34_15905, partial [Proteobacteria bacterium]|nr:hypothetical protein [Pseudomonadota bacterium]